MVSFMYCVDLWENSFNSASLASAIHVVLWGSSLSRRLTNWNNCLDSSKQSSCKSTPLPRFSGARGRSEAARAPLVLGARGESALDELRRRAALIRPKTKMKMSANARMAKRATCKNGASRKYPSTITAPADSEADNEGRIHRRKK